jgi:hypothetical protein
MADKGVKTPIPPSMVARVAAGLRYAFTGKEPVWFGPAEPLAPVAPPDTAGRAFDYPYSVNLQMQPRVGEAITFPMLRALADSYDLLRLVLETRKDQVVKMDWQVKPVGEGNGKKANDPRIAALQDFFKYPDRVHSWQAWLRILLEDMLVLDAPCVYPRRTVGGDLYGFEVIDGGTIKVVIDANGRPPIPPAPAYQQVLKGLPATEYTYDELVYIPRNPRAHKLYGYGPVEQIIVSVNMALRRQMHQLEFYTDGSVPDALLEVPADWTIDQIKEFQLWWDSILSGETAERRKVRFIPGGMKPHFTKEAILKDEMDEWLARIVCYCFSVAPTPFVKQMNRATAASVQEAALNEGLIPLLAWIKDFMDFIIWKFFKYSDLEFAWQMPKEIDADVQSVIQDRDVRAGIRTLDEVRDEKGLDAYPGGIGKEPLVYTSSGPVLLAEAIKPPEPVPAVLAPFVEGGASENPPGNEPPPIEPGGNGKPGQVAGGEEKTPPPAPQKVEKRGKKSTVNPIDRERPLIKAQTGEMKDTLEAGFKEVSKDVAAQVVKEVPDSPPADLADLAAEVEKVVMALDVSAINDVVAGIEANLEKVAADGAAMALIQINYDAPGITELLNEKALEYARERGAELVGKKIVDGELVDNPKAEWSIGENTRDMLRGDVSQAIEQGWSNDKLASVIEENHAFSPERAEMIARTETAFADTAGNMAAYRESGIVQGKQWVVGSEHDLDDECNENEAAGVIGLDEDFPSGDDGPPAHPNCCLPSSVVSAGGITASYKRWFEGEIVVLSFARINELSITPNHPILTRHGWVKAGKLQKGDELVYCTSPGKALALVYPDDHQMPTMIQDIPGALLMAGGMTALSVPSSPEDFHGDGSINGEVEIVWADSFLRNNVETQTLQNIKDKALSSGKFAGSVLDPDSAAAMFLKSNLTTAPGGIGSGSPDLSGLRAFPGGLNDMGPASGPDLQPEPVKSVPEGAAMAPDSPGNITRRLAGHISLVKLENVSFRKYAGHVYNLQTRDNYYIAQNLIVHNCVCAIMPALIEGVDMEEKSEG